MTRREQLTRFVGWLIGKHTQAEVDGTLTGRTFRRQTAWCWDLEPRLPPATQIHHAILVDGIWIAGWCLLIALSDTGRVLAWQWSGGESVAAWKALLEQVEAPGILVSDGGTGIPTALRAVWPETKHQRCLFHHRGLSEGHQKRDVEWFLVLNEMPLNDAIALAQHRAPQPDETEPETPEQISPYDTGLDSGEGLWHRTGWLRNR